jgi:hypothetical protein
MSGIPDPPLPFTGGRIPASEEERRLVERRVLQQFIVTPAVSFAMLLAGFSLGWPRVAALGVIGFGLAALRIGGLAVGERRLMFIRGGSMTHREYRYFIYEGLAAIPYGLAYVVAGGCVITLAVLFLTGTSLERMRDAVLTRPALGLIAAGVLLLCYGLGFVIGFVHRGGSRWQRAFGMLIDAPARLGGVIVIALAVVALTIGVVDWLSPAVFDRWFESIAGAPWPFRTY